MRRLLWVAVVFSPLSGRVRELRETVRLGVWSCDAITGEAREPGVCRPVWFGPRGISSFGLKPASSGQPALLNSFMHNRHLFEALCFLVKWECLGVNIPRGSGSSTYILETPLLVRDH